MAHVIPTRLPDRMWSVVTKMFVLLSFCISTFTDICQALNCVRSFMCMFLGMHAWRYCKCMFVQFRGASATSSLWKVDPLSPVPLPFVHDERGCIEILYMTHEPERPMSYRYIGITAAYRVACFLFHQIIVVLFSNLVISVLLVFNDRLLNYRILYNTISG